MRRFHLIVVLMVLLGAFAFCAFENNLFPLGVLFSLLFFGLPLIYFALDPAGSVAAPDADSRVTIVTDPIAPASSCESDPGENPALSNPPEALDSPDPAAGCSKHANL